MDNDFKGIRDLRYNNLIKKNEINKLEIEEYKINLNLNDLISIEKLYFLYELNKIDDTNFLIKKNEILKNYENKKDIVNIKRKSNNNDLIDKNNSNYIGWWLFNDTHVEHLTFDNVCAHFQRFQSATPYVLIFEKQIQG